MFTVEACTVCNLHKSSLGSPRGAAPSLAAHSSVCEPSQPVSSALTHSGKALLAHPELPCPALWAFRPLWSRTRPRAGSPGSPAGASSLAFLQWWPSQHRPAPLKPPIWSCSYLCHCLTFPLCSFNNSTGCFDLTPSMPAGSNSELDMQTLRTGTRNVLLMRKNGFLFLQHLFHLPS